MDLAARRASLDAIYGPTSGDLTVELWVGREGAGGVEVTGDGYAPGSLPDTDWDAADSDGVKRSSDLIDCGTPTEEWSDTITHYVLRGAGGVSWGCFRWNTPITIGGAGSPLMVQPAPFIGDNDN